MANISERYAEALYDKEKYSESLKIVSALYETEDFKQLVDNPRISNEQKMDVIKAVVSNDKIFINFINLLLKEGRMNLISDIYQKYMEKLNKENKVISITIVSANKLSNADIKQIIDKFKNLYEAKEIKYETKIDENLIGGVKVLIDGKVYDGSVRRKLDEILN